MEGIKIFLLVSGIIFIAAGIILLAFAALNNYSYHNLVDGEPSLYRRLRKRRKLYSSIGIPVLLIGAASEIIRFLI